MLAEHESLTKRIYGLIITRDLIGFCEIIKKTIEDVPKTARKKILSLCIRYGRVDFFEPFFKAHVPSGKNPLYEIRICKSFRLASAMIKIEMLKAFRAISPSTNVYYATAGQFLMTCRPKADLQLLKYLSATSFSPPHAESVSLNNILYAKLYNVLEFAVLYRPVLIDDIFSIKNDWLSRDNFNRKIFYKAIRRGKLEAVKGLIRHGFEIDNKRCKVSPLIKAIKAAKHSIAEYLISKGANLESKDTDGLTAFQISAQLCDIPLMRCLFRAGAKTDDKTWNNSAFILPFLYRPAHEERTILESVKFLINDVGLKYRIAKDDLLCLSMSRNYLELFEYLVTVCEDKDVLGKATRKSISDDSTSTFELLVKHDKLKINYDDTIRNRPIMEAVKQSVIWVERVIECGANVNIKCNCIWNSPLGLAARLGKIESIELLLKHGADANFIDKSGRGALNEAVLKIKKPQDREYFKVVETLLHAGADPDVVIIKDGELCDYINKFRSK